MFTTQEWPLPSGTWELVDKYASSLSFSVQPSWRMLHTGPRKVSRRIESQLSPAITCSDISLYFDCLLFLTSLPHFAFWDHFPNKLAHKFLSPNPLLGKPRLRQWSIASNEPSVLPHLVFQLELRLSPETFKNFFQSSDPYFCSYQQMTLLSLLQRRVQLSD